MLLRCCPLSKTKEILCHNLGCWCCAGPAELLDSLHAQSRPLFSWWNRKCRYYFIKYLNAYLVILLISFRCHTKQGRSLNSFTFCLHCLQGKESKKNERTINMNMDSRSFVFFYFLFIFSFSVGGITHILLALLATMMNDPQSSVYVVVVAISWPWSLFDDWSIFSNIVCLFGCYFE